MIRPRSSSAGWPRVPQGGIALFAILAWAAALTMASPASALTIHGRILKGEQRVPTQGVPVELHVVRGEEELPGKALSSDAGGNFQFTGLSADAGLQYYLTTEYEGSIYTDGPIPTTGGDATHDLVVYDVGSDIAAVRVTNHHIIVERQAALLHITEIVIFQNAGSTAYLGTGLNHAENVGVRLGLPAAVKNFQAGMGGDDQTVRVQGRDLSSSRPIPPGQHPFSFTYDVPFSGRMDLSHRLYFPTDDFVVLMNDATLKLDTKSLQFGGTRDQGGQKYQLYQGANFPVGADVQMKVGGASVWSNPKIYPWVAAPFLIVAVLLVARKKGRVAALKPTGVSAGLGHGAATGMVGVGEGPAGVVIGSSPVGPSPAPTSPRTHHAPSTNGDDLHAVYLYIITALDQGLERGEFSKESHALVRGNLKRRLETILSDQPRSR